MTLSTFRSTIQRLKGELTELEQREAQLKEERSGLESLRKISAEIAIKKSDRAEKQRKADRILNRLVNELSHVFGGPTLPEPSRLKSGFDDKFEKFSTAKKKIEAEIQRLRAEASSKRNHRKTVEQDLAAKEVSLKFLLLAISLPDHHSFFVLALDVTANCICEIHCSAIDGFNLSTVHKLSRKKIPA